VLDRCSVAALQEDMPGPPPPSANRDGHMPERWDQTQADALTRELLERLGERWESQGRPDHNTYLEQIEQAVQQACDTRDMARLRLMVEDVRAQVDRFPRPT
jgi:hypothetical protein